ncbi:MAG: hypothetical protein AAB036_03115 [Elusimicrobiota bacterium]
MTRRDLIAFGVLAAVILAFLAPVWAREAPSFFNHGDLYTFHWPLRHHSVSTIIQGYFPFWNPYVLLGVPHAANPQAALFYPPSALSFLLPVVTAMAWEQIFHLLWAALGAFLLARSLGSRRAAAVVLAASYALSPFLVYRVTAGIPTLLAALSWVPWAWLAWLCSRTALLSSVWAIQFFSGHPQFLLINAVAMLLWAAARESRMRLWGCLAKAACGAMMLAAVQWVATVQFLRGSNRAGWPVEFTHAYSLDWWAVLMWLWPGALGTPLDGGWKGAISVFYESGGVWLGIVMSCLAFLGLARERGRAGAILLVLAGLCLAFGVNGPMGFLSGIPGLSYLRTPARWSFFVLWGLWLLASAGLRALERRRFFLATIPFLVVAELSAWDFPFLTHHDPKEFTAANAAVAAALSGLPQRVLTDPELANPNKATVYRMRNVNGYDAFFPAGAARWALEAEGSPAADSSRIFVSRWRSQASARAGVGARLSASGIETTTGAWPLAAFLDRDGARVLPDPILTIERPERWRLAGDVPKEAASVSLAESRWPGWRAFLEGREVELRPWGPAFQLVPIAPSQSSLDLRFEFSPPGWSWLALVSLASWSFWFIRLAKFGVGT